MGTEYLAACPELSIAAPSDLAGSQYINPLLRANSDRAEPVLHAFENGFQRSGQICDQGEGDPESLCTSGPSAQGRRRVRRKLATKQ